MNVADFISSSVSPDSQYNVNVRNAWKLHDSKRDKWYLLVAKTAVAKQRWLKAFQDERRRVKEDAEHSEWGILRRNRELTEDNSFSFFLMYVLREKGCNVIL